MSSKQKYQLWWSNDRGERIMELTDWAYLNYSKVTNGIGTVNIGLPNNPRYRDLWRKDYHLEVYRRPELASDFRLENIFFMLETVVRSRVEDNVTVLDLSGHDGITLLQRRIVKYKSYSAQAKKTLPIDDMMKEIVDENMGAAAYADDPDRAVAYHRGCFQVQDDVSGGQTVTVEFSYRNVLEILKQLSNMADTLTPKVYFDVVPINSRLFEFRTYLNQRGADRRYSAGKSATIFSLENGNIEGPSYEIDTFVDKDRNVCYVAGSGIKLKRRRVERENTDLSLQSIWARSELYRDGRTSGDEVTPLSDLNDLGDAELGKYGWQRRFVANFLDAPNSRYGIDWDFGDRVTVSYGGYQIDAELKALQVTVTDDGKEKIYARNEFGEFGGGI